MLQMMVKPGMIFLAQDKGTGTIKEIAYLGPSPTSEYIKIVDLSSNSYSWILKKDFEVKYELLEFLGF